MHGAAVGGHSGGRIGHRSVAGRRGSLVSAAVEHPDDRPDVTPNTAPNTVPNTVSEPLDLDAIEGDLADVEAALGRLEAGTYWTDEVSGEPLDDDFLEQHPIARTRT